MKYLEGMERSKCWIYQFFVVEEVVEDEEEGEEEEEMKLDFIAGLQGLNLQEEKML